MIAISENYWTIIAGSIFCHIVSLDELKRRGQRFKNHIEKNDAVELHVCFGLP